MTTPTYLDEFNPPQRILMGPGPSSVNPRVLQAMTLPVLGHLDPQFFQVMDEVCEMLREVYHTDNYMTVPLSSTGTGAMEAACANVLGTGRQSNRLPQRLLRRPPGRHRRTLRCRGWSSWTLSGAIRWTCKSCPTPWNSTAQ